VALPPAAVLVAVVGVWYLVTYEFLAPRRRFLLPPPQRVVSEGFLDWSTFHEILSALKATATVALAGLGIAAAIGFVFAALMARARWVERSFYPWAVVLQTVPILAIVPLIGFWLGYGFWSRTVVCVLVALFTLRRASGWDRLVRLEIPSALPAVFAGLRISAGLAVIGAVVGDFFFRQGDPGIGQLIDDYTHSLSSGPLFAAVIVSSLFGLVMFWSFGLVSHLVVGSWHRPGRQP
jgi:NitT/TauT family transport system permease protein